jgi:hypothetical protein
MVESLGITGALIFVTLLILFYIICIHNLLYKIPQLKKDLRDKYKTIITVKVKEVEFFPTKTIKELRKMDEFQIGQVQFFSNSYGIKKIHFMEEERHIMHNAKNII